MGKRLIFWKLFINFDCTFYIFGWFEPLFSSQPKFLTVCCQQRVNETTYVANGTYTIWMRLCFILYTYLCPSRQYRTRRPCGYPTLEPLSYSNYPRITRPAAYTRIGTCIFYTVVYTYTNVKYSIPADVAVMFLLLLLFFRFTFGERENDQRIRIYKRNSWCWLGAAGKANIYV